MKKGLLIYLPNENHIFNIGDYIQSIAARQFVGDVDEYINREELNKERTEEVALIANGWYMHHPENWPPNDLIKPLFVALHINKLAENRLLSQESINYFKKHEPIGCRDYYTANNLQEKGIDAYFSGCLTLTLGKTFSHKKVENGKIYFTDVNSFLLPTKSFYLSCIKNFILNFALLKRIQKRFNKFEFYPTIKWICAFYTTYSHVISDELFLQAEYIKQEIEDTFGSEEEKFEYARNLLEKYSEARFVITSRIHCALPCLAMGTPVLYVDNLNMGEIHNCRLDGLRQLFHTIEIKDDNIKCDLLANGEKINARFEFSNKNAHIGLVSELTKCCDNFVNQL